MACNSKESTQWQLSWWMASNDMRNTGERQKEESHSFSLTWPLPIVISHGKFSSTFSDPKWPAPKSHFLISVFKSQMGECRAPTGLSGAIRLLCPATWVPKCRPSAYDINFAQQMPDTITRPFCCSSSGQKHFWLLQISQTLYNVMTLKFQQFIALKSQISEKLSMVIQQCLKIPFLKLSLHLLQQRTCLLHNLFPFLQVHRRL